MWGHPDQEEGPARVRREARARWLARAARRPVTIARRPPVRPPDADPDERARRTTDRDRVTRSALDRAAHTTSATRCADARHRSRACRSQRCSPNDAGIGRPAVRRLGGRRRVRPRQPAADRSPRSAQLIATVRPAAMRHHAAIADLPASTPSWRAAPLDDRRRRSTPTSRSCSSTSGTTGPPKPVPLRHSTVLAPARRRRRHGARAAATHAKARRRCRTSSRSRCRSGPGSTTSASRSASARRWC